jgi:hypothetical protein
MAMAAVTGAAAKLGQPMRAIDEKTATKVLQEVYWPIRTHAQLRPRALPRPSHTFPKSFAAAINFLVRRVVTNFFLTQYSWA